VNRHERRKAAVASAIPVTPGVARAASLINLSMGAVESLRDRHLARGGSLGDIVILIFVATPDRRGAMSARLGIPQPTNPADEALPIFTQDRAVFARACRGTHPQTAVALEKAPPEGGVYVALLDDDNLSLAIHFDGDDEPTVNAQGGAA
jgi:hypothetical protein